MTTKYIYAYPGALLADKMESAGMNADKLSVVTGLSRKRVNAILTERKPVTPRVAARLGKIFGDSPEIWMQDQSTK